MGALTRSATSLASMVDPSESAQTSAPICGRILASSCLASVIPHRTPALSGANSIVTTGLMFSLRRIVMVRCK